MRFPNLAASVIAILGCSHSPAPADAGMDAPVVVDAEPDAVVDAGIPDADAGGLVVLASGQAGPAGIAVDGTNVYWTNLGGPVPYSASFPASEVMKCTKGGCGAQPTAVATGQQGPVVIAVDATSVFWANVGAGTVMKCATAGCASATTVASGQGSPRGIAVDSTNVYWTASNGLDAGGGVMECAVGGCGGNPIALAPAVNPEGIAVDSTNVYWVHSLPGGVKRCAIAGCGGAPTVLASGGYGPVGIAVDAINVFWTDHGSPSPPTGMVMRCPTTGCTPQPVATKQGIPIGIAIDATTVYWVNRVGGEVSKCLIGGCVAPTVLASSQDGPLSIAVDATSVYWTNNSGGTVMKLTPK